MNLKRMIALLLCVATMFTLVSAEVYAADYTVTVKSNDGTTTLFTATVASGTVITFTTDGLSLSTGETYVYSGDKVCIGFKTYADSSYASYAAGMTRVINSPMTIYAMEVEQFEKHTIVGDAIVGANTYELYDKTFDLVELEDFPYYWMTRSHDGTRYNVLFSKNPILKTAVLNSSDTVVRLKEDDGNVVYAYSNLSLRDAYEKALNDYYSKKYSTGSYVMDISKTSADKMLYCNGTAFQFVSVRTDTVIVEQIPYETSYNLIATSDELYFDLDNIDLDLANHEFVVQAKSEDSYDSAYSNVVEYYCVKKYPIVYDTEYVSVVGIDGEEAPVKIPKGYPLSLNVRPQDGYGLPESVSVTVDGTALSSSYWQYDRETGNLVILRVTGEVEITAQGIRKVAAPVIERDSSAEFMDYPLALTFPTVANASGYSVYVDGTETTAFEMTEEDNTVMVKIKAEVFPKSATYNVYVVADPVEGYTVSDPSNVISATVAVQIATPVATAAPDLRTEEYPFVCKVTKPDHAVSLTAYLNGNHCGTLVYETDENGDWIVYVPTTVIDGSGDYELYFVAIGESTDYVESESSNRLTFSITKLATPVIWLE